MTDAVRGRLSLFNKAYVYESKSTFEVREVDPLGAGVARFSVAGFAVGITAHHQAPLIWSLDERKCADAAFLTFNDEDQATLHIVELKGHVRPANWPHVISQITGMFLTATAVAALLGVRQFSNVLCYVAGTKDGMSALSSSAPVLLKTAVGGRSTYGGYETWTTGRIPLPLGATGKLRKEWRDASGNVDFGSVS